MKQGAVSQAVLRPTLWRTARVLANPPRLKLFAHLLAADRLTVSELAERTNISRSQASLYLRQLNARGLIQPTRINANVYYEVGADSELPEAVLLVAALRQAFVRSPRAAERVYWLATAVTHPRRVAILAALGPSALDRAALMKRTGISKQALSRHLDKLDRRHLIQEHRGIWRRLPPASPLTRTIFRLVDGV